MDVQDEEAARQGAAGAILIHTTPSASYPWQVVETAWTGTQYSLPVAPGQAALPLKMWVTDDSARQIARRAGKDLDQLRTAAAHRGFAAVPLGVRVSATLHQTVARKVSPNVIGVLAGTEPTQGIIYTAHYDHFGIRDPKPGEAPDADRIYNGAVDNASGVSGILAIASAFARAPLRPRRSVYFLATTAEESGLLGAEYFVQHSPLPVDRIAADINVDSLNVLGPTRDLVLLGAERSTLGAIAKTILERRQRTPGVDMEPGAGYFFRSDHFPFAKSGVPAVSITEPNEYVGKDPAFAKKQHEETGTSGITSRAMNTILRGISPGPSRTCKRWPSWAGLSPPLRRCPCITVRNSRSTRLKKGAWHCAPMNNPMPHAFLSLVPLSAIQRAAERVRGVARTTPLLAVSSDDEWRHLWLKCENLQAGGAFKLRGAFNFVSARWRSACARRDHVLVG